jgi:hypothetical protein
MEAYGALETGAECERFAPALRALATGSASSRDLVEIRPHLRRCAACRATVRDLQRSRLRRLGLLVPLPSLLWRAPRVPGEPVPLAEMGADAVLPADVRVEWLGRLRQQLASLAHRANPSDVAAAIHIAATGGGGRIAALGAIAGLCLSGLGAGAVCVVTGVLDGPLGRLGRPGGNGQARRAPARPAPPHLAGGAERPAPLLADDLRVTRRTTARPAQAPARSTAARRPGATAPSRAADPSQGTAPTSQQHAPVSPAPAQPAAQEFRAAPASGSGARAVAAAAPATGGGEFVP